MRELKLTISKLKKDHAANVKALLKAHAAEMKTAAAKHVAAIKAKRLTEHNAVKQAAPAPEPVAEPQSAQLQRQLDALQAQAEFWRTQATLRPVVPAVDHTSGVQRSADALRAMLMLEFREMAGIIRGHPSLL